MTPAWDCTEARIALGVYVLGSIDPDERVQLDAHLATCGACQAELAELADLPALLALVPADEAIALADGLPGPVGMPPLVLPPRPEWSTGPWPDADRPSTVQHSTVQHSMGRSSTGQPARPAPQPAGLASIHDMSAARRRRQWLVRAVAVAAAAVVIGAASFGGVKLAGSGQPAAQAGGTDQHTNGVPNGPWETVRGTSGKVVVTVAYRSMGWGTQMDALVTGIPVDTPCQMWVVEADGQRVAVGGWTTDGAEGAVWYPASAYLPASAVKNFVITIAGRQQVTVKPA
jgi:hypothetical protein